MGSVFNGFRNRLLNQGSQVQGGGSLHCQDTVEHDEFSCVHFLKFSAIPETIELLFGDDQVVEQFDIQEVTGIDEFFCGGDIGPGRL